MLRDEFNALIEKATTDHPHWFQLERDAPAEEPDVREAERQMGVELPAEYRHFLVDHGGGYFAFAFVFGVDSTSDWFVVERNHPRLASFLAVSDPGTGDLYGFRVDERGRCGREVVVFEHETGGVRATSFVDFYEMMEAIGLRRERALR